MAVAAKASLADASTENKKQRRTKASSQVPATFPLTGLVRLSQILAPAGPIPVSRSAWWAGVKDGRFPKPIKLGPRTTVWRAEDIWALVNRTDEGQE